MTDDKHPVEAILAALANRLIRGYIDGYIYHANEWRLLKLVYQEKSECYYALVEIDSDYPEYRTAVFEVYGFISDVEMLDSDPAHVGCCEADFPNEVLEVKVL